MKIGLIDMRCDRRAMFETAIRNCGAIGNVRDVPNVDTSFVETLECDLVFVHVSNLKQDESGRNRRISLGASKYRIVMYSGGHIVLYREEMESGKVFRIRKRIDATSADEHLRTQIEEVIRSLSEEDAGATSGLAPWLIGYQEERALQVLVVLCQGYIATHGGRKSGGATLRGWDTLPVGLQDAATARKIDTEETGWWTPVFREECKKRVKDELVALGEEGKWFDTLNSRIDDETVSGALEHCERILQQHS